MLPASDSAQPVPVHSSLPGEMGRPFNWIRVGIIGIAVPTSVY